MVKSTRCGVGIYIGFWTLKWYMILWYDFMIWFLSFRSNSTALSMILKQFHLLGGSSIIYMYPIKCNKVSIEPSMPSIGCNKVFWELKQVCPTTQKKCMLRNLRYQYSSIECTNILSHWKDIYIKEKQGQINKEKEGPILT